MTIGWSSVGDLLINLVSGFASDYVAPRLCDGGDGENSGVSGA
jgi:hypothetical protein